uniref:G-protein coupled receptors family 1 profile domain-containing protein n=1 Tax=Ditylenchus dipsaci TaxID=166011 RepID=A0A915E924_9BILA
MCFALIFHVSTKELPVEKVSDCKVFGCLLKKTGGRSFFLTKIFLGVLIIGIGLIFIVKICHLSKEQKAIEDNNTYKKANKIAFVVLLCEFFLNFLPQSIILLLHEAWGITLDAGPYTGLLSALDVFITAAVYTKVLKRFIVGKSNTIKVISTIAANS